MSRTKGGSEMMYSMEVAAQTKRDRSVAEADQERTARAVRTEQNPEPERPWRGRLFRNVVRRVARAGAAA
jgi:hypothetical protein